MESLSSLPAFPSEVSVLEMNEELGEKTKRQRGAHCALGVLWSTRGGWEPWESSRWQMGSCQGWGHATPRAGLSVKMTAAAAPCSAGKQHPLLSLSLHSYPAALSPHPGTAGWSGAAPPCTGRQNASGFPGTAILWGPF